LDSEIASEASPVPIVVNLNEIEEQLDLRASERAEDAG
jgi:hypothetical protein